MRTGHSGSRPLQGKPLKQAPHAAGRSHGIRPPLRLQERDRSSAPGSYAPTPVWLEACDLLEHELRHERTAAWIHDFLQEIGIRHRAKREQMLEELLRQGAVVHTGGRGHQARYEHRRAAPQILRQGAA